MRKSFLLSTLLLTITSFNSYANSPIDLFEQEIISHVDSLKNHTQNILELSCDTQKDEIITNWQQGYSHYLAISYMDLEVINKYSLNYSFAFWPDKKNLIGKKMKSYLANTEFTSELVDSASAPIKGFQAVEYLLFDTSQKTLNCSALKAIVKNQSNNAHLIKNGLKDYPVVSHKLKEQDTKEAQSIVFNEISNHLSAIIKKVETVRNDKVNEKLYFSDAWRSKKAVFFHKENLKHSINYLNITSALLTQESQKTLNTQIEIVQEQIKTLPDSYFDIYKNNNQDTLFNHLSEIKALNSLMSDLILQDLDITLGFNNSDGD